MNEFSQRDRQFFDRWIADRLPAEIFDAHIHIFESSADPDPRGFARKFDGHFRFEECDAWLETLLGGRSFGYNCFGLPLPATDRPAADGYIGRNCDGVRRFGMALNAPYDAPEEPAGRIRANRLIGLKPYWNMVPGKQAAEVRIRDMFNEATLELADRLGLAVTLHISRPERLADPVNRRDMVEICREFPRIEFIFAHIGRAYYLSGVEGYLDELAQVSNAWLDTAMINHEGVLEYAMRHFPVERILFGSDAPIALLRGKSVEINDGYAYLMGENYRIGTSMYDPESRLEFTYFYLEQLRGVLLAAERAGVGATGVEQIFNRNARQLFQLIYRRNYA